MISIVPFWGRVVLLKPLHPRPRADTMPTVVVDVLVLLAAAHISCSLADGTTARAYSCLSNSISLGRNDAAHVVENRKESSTKQALVQAKLCGWCRTTSRSKLSMQNPRKDKLMQNPSHAMHTQDNMLPIMPCCFLKGFRAFMLPTFLRLLAGVPEAFAGVSRLLLSALAPSTVLIPRSINSNGVPDNRCRADRSSRRSFFPPFRIGPAGTNFLDSAGSASTSMCVPIGGRFEFLDFFPLIAHQARLSPIKRMFFLPPR